MAKPRGSYQKKLTDGEKVIKLAKERHKRAKDAQTPENQRYKFNIEFTYLPETQWPSAIAQQRKIDLRPCETVNRMPVFVRSIVNQWKQNSTGIKVLPADDGADKKTAEILTGLIRNIETQSNAVQIKGAAFANSVAGCKGFYRVVTEWEDGGFTQCIKILPIQNTLAVTYDCDDTSLDGSGWKWCFIDDELSKEEFESRYPDEDPEDWIEDDSGWVVGTNTEKKIRIAEYFYKEKSKVTLCMLDNGEVVRKDDLQPDMVVVDERESEEDKVKWIVLGGNAKEPLEQKEWAGKYIPVVPIWGDMQYVNGKRILLSALEYSHGAQRMLNYWRSTEIELLSLQNKAPYMITPTQLGEFENLWKSANASNAPYMLYNPDSQAPPPQRQGFPSPPSGVLQGAANAAQDIMDTSGIQEAGLGMQSNETSGRAINARAQQGQMATFQYSDNAKHADLYCGRILVDLIPRIYDTPQVVRTLGLDGAEKMVPINQPFKDKDKNGNPIDAIYDIGVGKYDVVISSAPAFSSMKQEAQELIAQATQGNPALWQTHGDLIFKAMDIPYADEFVERSKKTLPQGLAPQEDDEPQLPPQVQMQMQQMQEQMQQMDAMLQQQAHELQSKQAEQQFKAAELELKAREVSIKEMQAQAQIMQASQRDNINVSAEVPLDPENEYSEADKLELEIETRLHEKELERQHQIKMAVLNAKLAKGDIDGMTDVDDDGEDKPSEMACHMASIQEGIAKNQEITLALVEQVGQLANAATLSKVPVYDNSGKIIRVDVV